MGTNYPRKLGLLRCSWRDRPKGIWKTRLVADITPAVAHPGRRGSVPGFPLPGNPYKHRTAASPPRQAPGSWPPALNHLLVITCGGRVSSGSSWGWEWAQAERGAG